MVFDCSFYNWYSMVFCWKIFISKIFSFSLTTLIISYWWILLSFITFYAWYIIEWMCKSLWYSIMIDEWTCDLETPYEVLSFEREASMVEKDYDYLENRKMFAWLRHLWSGFGIAWLASVCWCVRARHRSLLTLFMRWAKRAYRLNGVSSGFL